MPRIVKTHCHPDVTALVLLTIGLAFSNTVSPVYADERVPLTVEEVLGLQSAGKVAISPGARYAAYTLTVPRAADDEPGGSYSEIWVVNRETGQNMCYSGEKGSTSSPQFSPDGNSLAFLDTSNKKSSSGYDSDDEFAGETTQIFLIAIDGGAAQQLTLHETSIISFRFSWDGSRIAFTAKDPQIEAEKRQARRSGRDWIIGGEERDHNLLWIFDLSTGASHRLFSETLHVSEYAWSMDNDTIVFTASESSTIDAEMMFSKNYQIPATGGTPTVVHPTVGKLGNIAFSSDDAMLAWQGAINISDSLSQSIFVLPADRKGEARNITDGWEASVKDFDWVDENHIVALCSEGTHTTISLVDVVTSRRQMLVADAPSTWGFAYDRESRLIALAGSTPQHPSEVFVIPIDDPAPQRLTFHNPVLKKRFLAPQKSIEWQSTDGQRIEGMLTFPINYEKERKYPLIVNPHGGPEGADRFSWDTWPQLLAARGYLVFQPNYRGSAGRGPNWTSGDHGDLGGMEFVDLLTGIDFLVEQGLVDADRVGIGGWSYGGYFSALGATHHSHRFKAAVMGAGIANWVSFTGSTDIPYENTHTHWNRRLNEHAFLYWKGSPLSGIAKANTPTLILHGQNDARVPVSQAYEMYLALKDQDVPVQLVVYPRNGHGVRERAHRIDLTTRMLAWFDQHVK